VLKIIDKIRSGINNRPNLNSNSSKNSNSSVIGRGSNDNIVDRVNGSAEPGATYRTGPKTANDMNRREKKLAETDPTRKESKKNKQLADLKRTEWSENNL